MSILKFTDTNIIKNKQLSKNFWAWEFSCKHCGHVVIDTDIIEKIQLLRDRLKTSVVLTNAYRCLVHNRRIGSSDTSLHVKGRAFDFYLKYTRNGYNTFIECTNIFSGVGFYQSGMNPKYSYMHCDNRENKLYWLSWIKKTNNKQTRVYLYFKDLENMYKYMINDKNIDWFNLVI